MNKMDQTNSMAQQSSHHQQVYTSQQTHSSAQQQWQPQYPLYLLLFCIFLTFYKYPQNQVHNVQYSNTQDNQANNNSQKKKNVFSKWW